MPCPALDPTGSVKKRRRKSWRSSTAGACRATATSAIRDSSTRCSRFEQEFAAYIGVRHAVATSSGTGALFLSYHVNGLKPGDEVIIPTYGFVATYTAAIFAGLVPVPAEIDDSLTLDPDDVQRRITPRTKAIVPIHMLGNPADMEAIGPSPSGTGWWSSRTAARRPARATRAARWAASAARRPSR